MLLPGENVGINLQTRDNGFFVQNSQVSKPLNYPLHPLQCVFWHKTNAAPNPRKNFASAVEAAVFARKPGKVLAWNGGAFTHNHWEMPTVFGQHKTHPTQKPIALMINCITPISTVNALILDPSCGSGTTCVAAKKLGRRYIGIDIEEKYCDIARDRLLGLEGKRLGKQHKRKGFFDVEG